MQKALSGFASWVTANPLDELEDAGAVPDAALHDAALWGNLKAVRRVLDSGRTDINEVNANGETALMWAAQQGHYDVVQLLIERGARLDQQNETGQSAVDMAKRGHHLDV
eukprot:3114145-Prymnesium_polylepis.1